MFGGLIAADAFGAFGKVIIFLASAVAIIAAHGWFEHGTEHASEYSVLILFSAVGGAVMVSATNLMALYVGLELTSLSSYVLASYRRSDERSAEAGLKYFVLGALASGILLYGISLLYGFTGTMAFPGIAAAFAREGTHSIGLLLGLVFLLAGIAFKISAVPFHMWTPDVYEGAPTPVTAFFASAPKVAGVLLATRVCLEALGPATDAWRQIVIVAALASILLGAVAAWGQTNIKRLLAYSSINNVGFALIGLAAAGPKGASSVLFYMAVYVVMTLGAFLCVLRMRGKDGEPVESLDSLSGLSQSRPDSPRRWRSSCSASPESRPCSASGPSYWCSMPRSTRGWSRSPSPAFSARWSGLIITCASSRSCISRMARRSWSGRASRWRALLILAAALMVSPLGYILIGPLGRFADRAAGSIF